MKCEIQNCNKETRSSKAALCNTHYARKYRHGDVNTVLKRTDCSIPGCLRKHNSLGYCKNHLEYFKRNGTPIKPIIKCKREGCETLLRIDNKIGYCKRHKSAWLYRNDLNHKLRQMLRNRLTKAVKRNQKSGSAVKCLGCSIEELKAYLEVRFQPGMSWDNHGDLPGCWHIDHITPLANFDLENREEFKKACHYSNLQPMWREENQRKNRFA